MPMGGPSPQWGGMPYGIPMKPGGGPICMCGMPGILGGGPPGYWWGPPGGKRGP